MKMLQIISGVGMVVGGGLLLLAWSKERKHPDQRRLGFGAIAIGCVLVLSGLF